MAAMNYRHLYHAGNFADVAKHLGLVYCLDALKRKDAALFVLDTHAGRGYYDLRPPKHRSQARPSAASGGCCARRARIPCSSLMLPPLAAVPAAE